MKALILTFGVFLIGGFPALSYAEANTSGEMPVYNDFGPAFANVEPPAFEGDMEAPAMVDLDVLRAIAPAAGETEEAIEGRMPEAVDVPVLPAEGAMPANDNDPKN